MQIRVVIISIMLFQLVILFGLWLHSNYISVIQKMTGDTSSVNSRHTVLTIEPECDRSQNATAGTLACCPQTSPHLVGPFRVEFNWDRTMESVRADLNSTLLEGGRYKPTDCISRHKVSKWMNWVVPCAKNTVIQLVDWPIKATSWPWII